MSKDFHYGVFVGRFQPLHIGHQHIIDEALAQVDTLIVGVGSADVARTPVNPFSFEERLDMIRMVYGHEINMGRILVVPLNDVPNDSVWAANVHEVVEEAILKHANPGGIRLNGIRDFKIALTGFGKDSSSFYLNMFPQWESIQIEAQHGTINATEIRYDLIRRLPRYPHDACHPSVVAWLKHFALTGTFKRLVIESDALKRDKLDYGEGPFLTADSILRHKGKILLVTRGGEIGHDLLAMPGGFVGANERFFDAALRELREETTIEGIAEYHTGFSIADNPKRSLRGRVVSAVYFFDIPDDVDVALPLGADDAKHADWYDFADLNRSMFFDDHYDLISDILSTVRH